MNKLFCKYSPENKLHNTAQHQKPIQKKTAMKNSFFNGKMANAEASTMMKNSTKLESAKDTKKISNDKKNRTKYPAKTKEIKMFYAPQNKTIQMRKTITYIKRQKASLVHYNGKDCQQAKASPHSPSPPSAKMQDSRDNKLHNTAS